MIAVRICTAPIIQSKGHFDKLSTGKDERGIKKDGLAPVFFCNKVVTTLATLGCSEAREAQDGLAAFAGLERNLTRLAALCAYRIEHLARTALVLTGIATGLAALWSREVAGGVKLLLTLGEGKVRTAVAARNRLVCHTTEKKKEIILFLLAAVSSLFPSVPCLKVDYLNFTLMGGGVNQIEEQRAKRKGQRKQVFPLCTVLFALDFPRHLDLHWSTFYHCLYPPYPG